MMIIDRLTFAWVTIAVASTAIASEKLMQQTRKRPGADGGQSIDIEKEKLRFPAALKQLGAKFRVDDDGRIIGVSLQSKS